MMPLLDIIAGLLAEIRAELASMTKSAMDADIGEVLTTTPS